MSKLVSGICMVIFLQKDLVKAMAFYNRLGFTLRGYQEGVWAEYEVGGSTIALCPVENEAFEAGGHTGVVFEVPDVMAIYDNREKLALVCCGEPVSGARGVVVTCEDPSGNRFDLYQKPDEKCCKSESATEPKDVSCKQSQGCC